MPAYRNDPSIKSAILEQLEAHRAAGELVHGVWWENGKGCAVGCTIHCADHAVYEARFGIPQMLARLEETIFEELPDGDAQVWPERFMGSIEPGMDLFRVGWEFLHWLLTDKEINPGIAHPHVCDAVKQCADVVALLMHGAPTYAAQSALAESARNAAWSARRAAWSATCAANAAEGGAENPWSAAWRATCAAWSAMGAAESTRCAAWSAQSAAYAAQSAADAAQSAADAAESTRCAADSARSATWSALSAGESARCAAESTRSAAYTAQGAGESARYAAESATCAAGKVASPLWSNIYPTPFDHTMTKPGYRLTSWEKDFVVVCRTRREAEAALVTARIMADKLIDLIRQAQ